MLNIMNYAIFPNNDKSYLLNTVVIILTVTDLYNLEDFRCLSGEGGGKDLMTLGFKANEVSPFPSAHYTGPIRILYLYHKSFLNQIDHQYIKDIIIPMVDKRLKSIFKMRYGLKYENLKLQKLCPLKYTIFEKKVKCEGGGSCPMNCDGVEIPQKYFRKCNLDPSDYKDSEGVSDTDYIVNIHSKFKCDKDAAKAKTCFLNEVDAPVGGSLFICPFIINKKLNRIVLRDLLVHQFFHLFGFMPYLHQFARDDNARSKCERDEKCFPKYTYLPYKTCYRPGNIQIQRRNYLNDVRTAQLDAYSNILIDTVKHYFKCDKMRLGFATEKYRYLHFDELYFGNEIMTILPNPLLDKITRFSLEFMATLGWYNIQLEEAESFDYLENSDCNFVKFGMLKFRSINHGKALAPYCDIPYLPGKVFSCRDYVTYHYCDLIKTNVLKEEQKYFNELKGLKLPEVLKWSGSRSFMDRYPTLQTLYFTNRKSSFCLDAESYYKPQNDNFVDSYHGNDSQCFSHNLYNPTPSTFYGAACHKIAHLNDKAFNIFVHNVKYVCPYSSRINVTIGNVTINIECGADKIENRGKDITKRQKNKSLMTQNNNLMIIFLEIVYIYKLNDL